MKLLERAFFDESGTFLQTFLTNYGQVIKWEYLIATRK